MDPSFVKCDEERIDGVYWFDYVEREFLLKLIPRGEGNSNVHNEVAFLSNCWQSLKLFTNSVR